MRQQDKWSALHIQVDNAADRMRQVDRAYRYLDQRYEEGISHYRKDVWYLVLAGAMFLFGMWL
jgi:hypothetical protein